MSEGGTQGAVQPVGRDAVWLTPVFSHPRVGALMSTRLGGVSRAPFDSFNLRPGIGDDEQAVLANRARWVEHVGVPPQRVDQVHGAQVAVWREAPAGSGPWVVADASCTRLSGLACEIQVADCLPVLFADRDGRVVGAAHAGWRGLAGGVLEASVAALCGDDLRPGELEAWLGPCIGPRAFEVGDEVRSAFLAVAGSGADRTSTRFTPGPVPGKWCADLAGLARDRLADLRLGRIFGNDSSLAWCTLSQASRFFSYRRDRITGRMAVAIWLRSG